jgi:hypothetical protein
VADLSRAVRGQGQGRDRGQVCRHPQGLSPR